MFQHTKIRYIYRFQNLSLGFILKIFLKFHKFQPLYSYKIYSYIKKECKRTCKGRMEYVFAMYHLTPHLKSKRINITRNIGEMLHTFFKTAAERKLCSFSHAILRRSPAGSKRY